MVKWAKWMWASKRRKILVSLLPLAIAFGVLGYLTEHGHVCLGDFIENILRDYHANIATEIFFFAAMALVFDWLNERREIADLILQMGSPDQGFATEAVRKLRAQGWLQDGTCRRADLYGANLTMTRLADADLSGADLRKADLVDANLVDANLSGADLTYANLERANLHKARLDSSNLSVAHLHEANLSEADLSGADLSGAELFLANLSGANLSGANLSGARVSDEQLAQAKSLEGATMPDGTVHE